MKIRLLMLRLGLWGAMACTVIAVVCDAIVRLRAGGRCFDDAERVPHNKMGLVLGTSPLAPDGGANMYFVYRVEAAARLYKMGKVDWLLLSGDRSGEDYDEPQAMRDALIAHGVPVESIVLDKSGFRTLNSIVHTNKVYGQSSVTIISQRFHNQRAVFLALCNGVDAVAYNAEDVVKWNKYLKIHGREYLARVRMFVDLIMRREKR